MTVQLSHDAYRVGWICPAEVEQTVAVDMLDERHERLSQPRGDTNAYNLGSINGYNIVIAGLPRAGNCFAATVITQMRMTFPSLQYCLLVGIGGGVPVKTDCGLIRLGHVVVSEPTGIHSGTVQYDHGKAKSGQFERKGSLAPPPTALINAARELAVERRRMNHDPIWENTKRIKTDRRASRRFKFPGTANDHLYRPDYEHQQEGLSCEEGGCDTEQCIKRPIDEEEEDNAFVVVHRGTIASGELLITDAKKRDDLAKEHGVLCFETEAAGALTDFPCMTIRGISDYCDSHKNDIWRGYAAAVAAAYARQLFFYMPIEETQGSELGKGFSSRSVALPQSKRLKMTPYSAERDIEGIPNCEARSQHKSRPHYVIPSLANRHFTGRNSTLDALRQKLFIKADSQRVALFGLGGLGKTQVALQLADWVKKNIPECSIFWVPALSLESFERACSQIAKKLKIHQSSDDNTMELVCQHLNSDAAGRWFFIVDNADDADLLFNELEEYIPTNENGTVLLTTRSPDVAVSFAQTDTIELQKMTPEEATIFLAKVVREDLLYDQKSTAQLLEELFMLPLAITQAAFYMSRLGISTSRYLEIMHNTERDRANLASRSFHDNTRYPKSSNAVATTWFISFDQIKKIDPLAAELLGFLSYIEPKAIPRSVLPPLTSEEEMEFAIGTLCGYAFLTKRDDRRIFDMHGLVQLSTRLWLKEQGQEHQAIESAIRRMEGCFPSDDYTNRETWRAYLPHALQVIRLDEDKDISERYLLLSKVAYCISADGRAKDAISYFEEVNAWNARHPEDYPDRLVSQHALAGAYLENGQIKQAMELLEHVVAVHKTTLNTEHFNRLVSQHTLAEAYLDNGQIKQAVELLEHVVAVKETTLNTEHPSRLASQHTLAGAYLENGQIKQAMELLEHVVAVKETTLNTEHPNRLASQHALAGVYLENGQIKQAVELLEHVVAVEEKTLDVEHPDRLRSQCNLAMLYLSSVRIKLKEAAELLEHVVAVEEKTLDVEHPDQLRSQCNLAMSDLSSSRIKLKEIVELLEHVVAVRERTLDENHPDRPRYQYNLAMSDLPSVRIKLEEIMELLEHVVAVRERTLDENHPDRLGSQRPLAKAYQAARANSSMDHSE